MTIVYIRSYDSTLEINIIQYICYTNKYIAHSAKHFRIYSSIKYTKYYKKLFRHR